MAARLDKVLWYRKLVGSIADITTGIKPLF